MKHRNQFQLIVKSFILLFLLFFVKSVLAEDEEQVIAYSLNNKYYILTNRQLEEKELLKIKEKYKTVPVIVPYEVKYKLGGKVYTMTDEDLSYLDKFEVANLDRRYRESQKYSTELYDLIQVRKEKKEGDYISFSPNAVETYKKGRVVPLIPNKILRKTNNLWIYLGTGLDENGQQTILYPTANTINSVHSLKQKAHYKKKKQIINGYKKIIRQISSLKMTELKEKFALSEIEISYCLTLNKDNHQEVYELFFHKLSSNQKGAFLVVDIRNNKFYYLKDIDGKLKNFFIHVLRTSS